MKQRKNRRAVRAFCLAFGITAMLWMAACAGLLADVRTRRMYSGRRAESMYAAMAAAVRLSVPLPSADIAAPEPLTLIPYPVRVLTAVGDALEQWLRETPPRSADAEFF